MGGRATASFNGTISFQWSSDGTNYNTVAFTNVGNTAAWALVNSGVRIVLPAGAEGQANLRFRFNGTPPGVSVAGNYRIDDFTVQGTAASTDYFWNGNGASPLSAGFNTGPWSLSASTAPTLTWPASGTNNANLTNVQGGTVTMPTTFNSSPNNVILGSGNYIFNTAASTPSTLSSPVNLGSNTLTLSPNATSAALTLSGIISGTGGSLISNTGTATLSNANTFTGGVTLTSGTLNINNAAALGTTAGTFSINGGTIDNTSGASITTSNYPQSWGGDFAFTGTNALNLGTGPVAMSAARQVTVNSGTLTVGGIISGNTFGLTKAGNGTLALGGVSTFNGGVNINGGTLQMITGTNRLASTNAVTLANTAGVTFNLNNFSQTIGSIAGGGLTGGNISLGTATLTTGGDNSNTSFDGIISGTSGSIVKAGSGSFTLTNANTYTGGTTLNAGTLNINNAAALGTGTFTINGGTVDNTSGAAITNSNNNVQTWGGDFIFTGTNNLNMGTGAVAMSAGRTLNINAGTLTIGGIVSGSGFALTKSGNGILALQGVNTYSGGTVINAGVITVNGPNRLGNASGSLTINAGTFQLTTTSISSARSIVLGNAASVIDIASGITYTTSLTGDIRGTGTLNKTGAGKLALTEVCTYNGSTKIAAGTIQLNAADLIPATQLFLDGGTFSTGATTGFNETTGTLNLNTTGTIALGTGSHVLTFSASNGVSWAGTSLNITGWTGTAGTSGSAGKIFVGTDATGLDASQMAKITFAGYAGVTATILPTGEIVPAVSTSPTISTVGTLNAVGTVYGTATATPTTFTATGSNLTSDIVINALSGFEYSQTPGGASGYATTQTLTQSGGTVATTTIYVRIAATTVPGTYSGNISLTSTGATTVNVATASSIVTPKTVIISGLTGDNKIYDGLTTATFTGTADISASLVNGDVASLTGTATASFLTKTVGTSKTVNVTGYSLTGANASNYALATPNVALSADISAATLTVASGANAANKVYDGNTVASISAGTLTGVINPDVVSISTSGTFASASVGTGISVTLALTGPDAANYVLTQPGRTADITQASQTISGLPATSSKLTNDVPYALTATASSGLTVTYSSSNPAVATISGSTVTITGAGVTTITASQAGNSNYLAAPDVTQTLTVSTPIVAGDVAIIGFGSTGTDKFAFLLTRDIPANTVLVFTDNAWTGSVLNSNENTSTWTSPNSVLAAGTVVSISGLTVSSGHGAVVGALSGLAGSGDQVICYTGSSASPTFIAAFSSSVWLTTGATSSNTSYLPSGLIAGVTASNFSSNSSTNDNGYYNNILTGPIAVIRSLVNNQANWLTSASSQTFPFGTGNGYVTISNSAVLVSNATITNLPLAAGETFAIGSNIFIINGQVSGSGTLTGSSTSNLTIGGTAGTLNFTAASRSLNNLTLNASSSATLGTALDVYGTIALTTATLNLNAQNLTLKSNSSGTARIANLTGSTLSGETNVTMERFIPLRAGLGRAYRFLASTVNTTTNMRTNWMEGGQVTTVGGSSDPVPDYGTHITGNAPLTNDFDVTQNNQSSIYTVANGGTSATLVYTPVPNASATMSANQGYFLFVRGNRSESLSLPTTPGMATSATTLRTTGTLVTGTQSSFGTMVGGAGSLNQVTNPYPSPIDWESVRASCTGINNAYTIWDPNMGSRGGFVTWSLGSGASSGAALRFIQPGQAFFVEASGASAPTVIIQESHKAAVNNNGVFFTPPPPTEGFRIELYYTEPSSFRRLADGAVAIFDNNYSAGNDAYDASEINNWDENIAIARDGKHLAIEGRPVIVSKDTIPLFMNNMKQQAYEFEFTPAQFTNPGLKAELIDNFLNTRTLLSVTAPTVVAFTVTADAASKASDRFKVVFGSFGGLAVDVLTIKAQAKQNGVQVDWTSKTETDMASYEVEKSAFGASFTKVNTTIALGNSTIPVSYNWFDANPVTGTNFYRVKGVDRAGNTKYSDIVKVSFGKGEPGIVVYPNPMEGKSFKMDLNNLLKGTYVLNLYNNMGQLVYTEQLRHDGIQVTRIINLKTDIAKGAYQLQLSSDNGFKTTQTIFKN